VTTVLLSGLRKRKLATASLILFLFLAGSLLTGNLKQARADTTYSVNTIVNPSFESMPPLSGWEPDVYNDGNYYSTITADNAMHVTGSYSARLDVSNNPTAIKTGNKNITQAHLSLAQYPPPKTFFNNLTDRPDGLNLWFYIQPKFTGYTIFEVRIRTGAVWEMDYIYYNPIIPYGWGNSTTGSELGKPLKQIILPAPPLNQWNHLVRNVKQDWLSPLKLPNGTLAPGFPLNDTIYRIEVNANFYRDSIKNLVYAETAWVDDVAIYLGSLMPLPNFSFQDKAGDSVDGSITRTIVDARGVQASLTPGTIIPSGSYTLRAYYQGYLILANPITPATPSTIQLQMVAIGTSRSTYLVFNSTITSATLVENSSSRIVFSVVGTGPSLIIMKVPVTPLNVERDGNMISSWTYNSTTRTVAIQTATLGTFTMVYSNPTPPTSPLYYIGALIAGALVVITSALLWRRKTHSSKPTAAKRNGKAASMKQFKPKSKKSSSRS
jgi:hypothetical protein